MKLKMGILSVRGGKKCRWRRERLIIGEKRRYFLIRAGKEKVRKEHMGHGEVV
jgi:hypothetical protein